MSWKKSFATASLRRQCLLLRLARYELQVENNCRKDTRPKLSQPSQSEAYGLQADGCDSPHSNRSSNRQPTWTGTEWPPLLIQLWASYDIKSFTVGHFRHSNSKDECNITYCNYREELSVEDGVLFNAHRLVIPTLPRAEYLKDLQTGYLAGEKTLLEAHQTVFWSGISDFERNAVKLCDVCLKYKPAQQKEPLIPHDNTLAKAILNGKISLKPWSKS